MAEVLRHLEKAVPLPDRTGSTDGELLRSFTAQGDPEAFAELVRRHGPLVWGVCRRLLQHHHDAEDAFQATFLLLAKKADSIASRERLAGWLHGVASNTALKARAMAIRRRRRERQAVDLPEPEATNPVGDNDLRRLIDQELGRLPDKYRLVVLLCDLEGKTRQEAARQLGVPEGTVASRLARARALLARRLAGHGLAVSGGLSAALVGEALPPSALAATVESARQIAAGEVVAGLVSPGVTTLMEGVLRAMVLTRLKRTLAVLLVSVGILSGPFLLIHASSKPEADRPREGRLEKGPPAGALPLRAGAKYRFCEPPGSRLSDAEFVVLGPPTSNWARVDGGDGIRGWHNLDHVLAIVVLNKEREAGRKRPRPGEKARPGTPPLKVGENYLFRLPVGTRRWAETEFLVLQPPSGHWVKVDFGDGTRGWLNLRYTHGVFSVPREPGKRK
jgi:RNA polymerase sigma factor (sigma-70 family)